MRVFTGVIIPTAHQKCDIIIITIIIPHLFANLKGKYEKNFQNVLTHSLREPGGPCTKSMEVSESRMERVNMMSI